MAGAMPQTTPGGYSTWEAVSAMQKAIRRSEEVLAMQWFCELEGAGLYAVAANRLRVTAAEDVGLGDMQASGYALQCINEAERFHKAQKGSWRLFIGNAIRTLSRAEKSREGDHFQAAARWRLRKSPPEIPDYALDKHTLRGKQMGRGVDHFMAEGAVLVPEPEPDAYEEDAYRQWKAEEQSKDMFAR